MFKLTEKAKAFNQFIIHHNEVSVTDYSSYSCKQEVWEDVKDEEWVDEEIEFSSIENIKKQFISCLETFTPDEVLSAAESGYGWPEELGLVEEFEEDEDMRLTESQKILAVRKNGWKVLDLERVSFAVALEAVRSQPQVAHKLCRKMQIEEICTPAQIERVFLHAVKRKPHLIHACVHTLNTHAARAASVEGGEDISRINPPF